MPANASAVEVYLETGKSKTFAVAPDWPGWSRSGRDEDAALQALLDYAPRYASAIKPARLGFSVPKSLDALVVVGRLAGNATTDFGAPNVDLPHDADPVSADELARWKKLLKACWQAFDAAVADAAGKALRKGPRGGGRDLDKIVEHVRDVDTGYLANLGHRVKLPGDMPPDAALGVIRDEILTALDAAVAGELPARGPRGGLRWTPRYFVRRLAWHELDHAWEIEDRAE